MPEPVDSIPQQDLEALPGDILELASLLAPAVHIDSTFLRNFRSNIMPYSDSGLEARLWYSDLVASRGSTVITLDWEQVEGLGRASFTATPDRFQAGWALIEALHLNLPGNLRLQEALRYASITNQPVDELVARIHRTLSELTDAEQRRSLSRWLKATVPELSDREQELHEVQWLAAVAKVELGDSPSGFSQQEYDRSRDIPDWLFPERVIHPKQNLGLQLTPGVLSVVEPAQNAALLPLETDKPTLLRVTWEFANGTSGGWLQTRLGSQLAIDQHCRSVKILVPDGRAFRLWAERFQDQDIAQREFILLHHPEDRERALILQGLLQERKIEVELREENLAQPDRDFTDQSVICLWTQVAADHWQGSFENTGMGPSGILLRTDSGARLPQGMGSADTIDLLDLEDNESLEQAIHSLRNLKLEPPAPYSGYTTEVQRLLDEIEDPEITPKRGMEISARLAFLLSELHDFQPDPRIEKIASSDYYVEMQNLLGEMKDPATPPRRRLEIGDRLAELGDPRPGVGVYEAEVDEGRAESPHESEAATVYPPEVQSLLEEINIIQTPPKRRLAIGDELAKLGDPRPGVGLDERGVPDIDWVEIPAGSFVYGEGETQKEIHHERFLISRYPITNAQFQAFVDAGGYEKQGWLKKLTGSGRTDADWWQGLKQPKPKKSNWDQPNRPRTDVDWYEAVAFTRWLSAHLNQPIRLPTEQEWEKAARGTDGRKYPWGDKYINGYANVDESGEKGARLQQTTAVGLYPKDESPYGVRDLAGNVWEWCLNKYDHPEQIELDSSGARRVLRGGSWIGDPVYARSALRYGRSPGFRDGRRGFRVLLSAPIV